MNLPYDDGSFDACRAKTLSQHLTDPQQAVHEMTRVTRPGGRAATPESGTGTTLAGHPDRETTQVIPHRPADDAAQAWIGRQPPRLFRHAGDDPRRPADDPDAAEPPRRPAWRRERANPAASAAVVVPA